MRQIVLEGRVTRLTSYAVDCIAWASNRRGHRGWKSRNVANEIHGYLVRNNVQLDVLFPGRRDTKQIEARVRTLTPLKLRRILDILVGQTYAVRQVNGRGVMTRFEFKADVTLTGHSPIFVPKQEEDSTLTPTAQPAPVAQPAPTAPAEPVAHPTPTEPAEPMNIRFERTEQLLPLPIIKPQRYRSIEIEDLLDKFAERHPETYAEYADRLTDALEALMDQN